MLRPDCIMRGMEFARRWRSDAQRWIRYALAAAGLCGLQLLGEAIVNRAHWPVPGSLVGLVILFALLTVLGRVPDSVDAVSAPLLRHLMLLLIPSVASVMVYGELIAAGATTFVAASVLGTALTALATALTLRLLWRRRQA